MAIQVFVKGHARHPGEPSGDAFWYAEEGRRLWIMVVDGLGSGPEAAAPAGEAVRCIRTHVEKTPDPLNVPRTLENMLQACDHALKGSRGAAMGLATFDMESGVGHYTGVGNVELRVLGAGASCHPVVQAGILGTGLRKVRVEEFPYRVGDLIIMHSDGLSSRFSVPEAMAQGWSLDALGERLVAEWGKATDDMTVVLARQYAA